LINPNPRYRLRRREYQEKTLLSYPYCITSKRRGQRLGGGNVIQEYYINTMPKLIKEIKDSRKTRSLRLSDEIWHDFVILKPRDKSWELFMKELLEIIQHFKDL